jgi:SWI/SNF-related matrix-associated actin-dependent regulator of chromatin subfamily A-like protein 1
VITIDAHGENLAISFPYEAVSMEAVASIPGSVWFSPGNCWLVPPSAAHAVMLFASGLPEPGTLTEAAQLIFRAAEDRHLRAEASKALTTDWHPTKPLGIQLYPAQRAGVEYAVHHAGGRVIIGDEPGVGKTAQALAIINEMDLYPAVIVPPAMLKENWRREARSVLPGKTVEVLNGAKPTHRLFWADVNIINYDILHHWLDYLPDPGAVVLDEAHMILNLQTIRARACLTLLDRSRGRLALTGTPYMNKTAEGLSLITAIGREDDFGGRTMRATYGKKPLALHKALTETCYLRRRKVDAYADMPGRFWRELYVEGDPAVMEEYRAAEADIVNYLKRRARELMAASGATDDEARVAAWQAGIKAEAAQHLVALNHLRQLAARAKMPAALQWARDFQRGGEKLSIWGWHREVVDGAADALQAVKISGGMPDAVRQQSVDLFQSNPHIKTIACQITAAGVGLTLTAGSTALFVEQGWNPGTMDQALDRHHRLGQTDTVFGYVAIIPDTVDAMMWELIATKRVEVDAATDGIAAEGMESSVMQNLLVDLTRRGLTTNPG